MEPKKYTLKELRARHNLTQGQLGELLGLQRLAMHLYEKNPERLNNMPYRMMLKMAEILGVDPEEIYKGDDKVCGE